MIVFVVTLIYSLYVLIAVLISRGIHSRYRLNSDLPTVSVVVPCRNEEKHIKGLLDSLAKLDYPDDRLQVIIVDDQSEDRTRELAVSYADRFRCRYEVHDVTDEPDGRLKLKTRPLAQGLDKAVGEIVLMTDADCIVPSQWVRGVVKFYDRDVGMVCGMTVPSINGHAKIPLTWFETLDWFFLLGVSAGMSGQGRAQALIGNNFSVRMQAYRDIGTFRGLTYTEADDLAMLNGIENSKRWKSVFPAAPDAVVYTEPSQSLLEMIRQRRRWIKGATQLEWTGKLVILFGIAGHVAWPFLISSLGWFIMVPIGLLMIGDSIIISRMMRRYGVASRLRWLVPLYPFFATVYGSILTMFLFRRRIRWKERVV